MMCLALLGTIAAMGFIGKVQDGQVWIVGCQDAFGRPSVMQTVLYHTDMNPRNQEKE